MTQSESLHIPVHRGCRSGRGQRRDWGHEGVQSIIDVDGGVSTHHGCVQEGLTCSRANDHGFSVGAIIADLGRWY